MKSRLAMVAVVGLLAACASTDAGGSAARHRPSGLGDLTPTFSHRLEAAYSRQTKTVATDCFPPALVAVLDQIGKEFGRKPMVTSGYRPKAGSSQHARCRAADIRVPGVSPSRVAAVARRINGIGGVGTYCHVSIVHVDVGPRRDWAMKCRGR